jgi:GTPase SAR1 family protein
MLNIISGVEKTPIKFCIYGAEGVGKTSLASKMPDPLFLDTEGGTSRLDVRRIKITSWEELIGTIKEVIDNPDVCKTLVVDTADWAESLCSDFICNKYRKANIEDFGFGKGYTYLAEEFSNLLQLLSKLVDVGINPVVIAHGKPRK